LLADENIDHVLVAGLRTIGHDVVYVREAAPRTPDVDVLAWARADDRALLTYDAGFGALIFRHGLSPPPAVILIRLPSGFGRMDEAALVMAALPLDADFTGQVVVINSRRVRRTLLPNMTRQI